MILQISRKLQKELSYRKQIARQLRTKYVEVIHRPKYYIMTLKSRLGSLKITENGTKTSYLTVNIIVTLKCGLEVTQDH